MNANITDAMLRYGVGLNPWFFEKTEGKPKFPPHNITQIGENRYRLTLAVAGYTQDELKITLLGELLTITGAKQGCLQKDAELGQWTIMPEGPDHRVVYRGIAFRNFTSEFLIGQHVEIDVVTLKHGLLDIDLVREIPEAEKLKEIPIST